MTDLIENLGASRRPNGPDSDTANVGLLLPSDSRLENALGHALSPGDMKTWAGMPKKQREKALQRIAALDRYCSAENTLSAKQAAADAGVQLGRFYQIARQWREKRSLANLGSYASATKTRKVLKPEVTNALQAAVARVVSSNPDKSIAALAKLLAIASGLPTNKIPVQNTLRPFIEREKRRRQQAKLAGSELLFDLSASSLQRDDGRHHVVFLLIDKGTNLILGHSEGLAANSFEGYREAASDALLRISKLLMTKRIWSQRMQQPQMIPGLDADTLGSRLSSIREEMGGWTPQLAKGSSEGAYIRRHLGLNLGTVRLTPSRTTKDGAVAAGTSLSKTDAYARVELAVADYNAELLHTLNLDGEDHPPGELVRLLEMIAEA